jgi:hypothetical protein
VFSYSLFFSYFVDALTAANAHIGALEAEINASRKLGKVPMLPRLLLRRLLNQQKPRLKKLKKVLPLLTRSGSKENKQ